MRECSEESVRCKQTTSGIVFLINVEKKSFVKIVVACQITGAVLIFSNKKISVDAIGVTT